MNCNEARRHWNLYHDSEGDAELHFRIGEHLTVCPECAEWFAQQSRLEALLAEKLGSQPATPELWNRVLKGAGLRRPARSRRWLVLAGVAASVVLALLVLWDRLGTTGQAPDLARLGAARHERLAAGEEAAEFQSRSDLEVEAYLRKRVSFPVRCPPRKDAGFAVRGAGVCALGDQPAAYLTGQVDEAPVSIFVLPRDSLSAFPQQEQAVRDDKKHHRHEGGYGMVLGVIDRNVVLVVGRTDAPRLERVWNAYGTYPDHH